MDGTHSNLRQTHVRTYDGGRPTSELDRWDIFRGTPEQAARAALNYATIGIQRGNPVAVEVFGTCCDCPHENDQYRNECGTMCCRRMMYGSCAHGEKVVYRLELTSKGWTEA